MRQRFGGAIRSFVLTPLLQLGLELVLSLLPGFGMDDLIDLCDPSYMLYSKQR